MYKIEKEISSEKVYEGIIVDVLIEDIELPNGRPSKREVVVHPGGVCILPLDDEGNIYLVEQYRYAACSLLLEAPAGKLEQGEDPFECAKRELKEETGFAAAKWIPLGSIYTSPGFSTEKLYVYMALDLKRGNACPDEDEFVELRKMKFSELIELINKNGISDGKTIIAALKARMYLKKL